MANKKHLRIIGEKQLGEHSKIKFNYGFPSEDDKEEENQNPNYYYMAVRFQENILRFESDRINRQNTRKLDLKIPENIEYVFFDFINQFVISDYYNDWYNKFGLEGVSFTNFGHNGLFAIINKELFKRFIIEVHNFINHNLNNLYDIEFSRYLTYVSSFKLLTSTDIIKFKSENIGSLVNINLIDLPLDYKLQEQWVVSLENFLKDNQVEFIFDENANKLELINPSFDLIKIIADNFDIVQSVTCSLSTVIRPSNHNIVKREYGFVISNSTEDLPLIGIIDTGISMQTPLAPIVINDTSFTLNGNPLIDIAGRWNEGHGTAVAALASLGRNFYYKNFSGSIEADAKLLSIKISETGISYLSEKKLIEMLYSVKKKYPELSFFVLTTCYDNHKSTNESFSTYAYELDKFATETDSLIFICTGNNNKAADENKNYNISYFNQPHTNLCTPAECMNNVIVGAAAESLMGNFKGISDGREFPTLFTRKSHFDLKSLYPKNKSNKNFFRPDVIECAGDYEFHNILSIGQGENAAMQVLSANPSEGFYKQIGTSFSAPLVANLAAKLKRQYPSLKSQTIKALIINGASLNKIRFTKPEAKLVNQIAGNGFINLEESLFSTENRATLILEDKLVNEEMKIYPVNFPKYLVEDDLGKKSSILKVTATLCFSFKPIPNNQLSYNPIHMAFCFFKNHTAAEINSKNEDCNSKLKSNLNWSQSGRHISKPIPYSNTQKIEFVLGVNDLENETLTLKLAIHAKLTSQLLASEYENYPKEYPFSLVVSIEETVKKNTNKLYDQLILNNELEAITDIELENTLEL